MQRTLGVNLSRHVLAKTATTQRMNASSQSTLLLVWSHGRRQARSGQILEDAWGRGYNAPSIPLQLVFYDTIRAVLYAANRLIFFKCLQSIMTRTIKYHQDGIRVKIVLKLTHKLKMVEIETDSSIDV